jgi:hypothetical protein
MFQRIGKNNFLGTFASQEEAVRTYDRVMMSPRPL